MKSKTIIRGLLLVFALGSLAVWAAREIKKSKAMAEFAAAPKVEEKLPAVAGKQVVLTYFRNNIRCSSCKKIEALTTETAQKEFADELANGKLVFRVIDVDEPANNHYIKDYRLTTKSVVISLRVDGKETSWTDMEKIWDLLGEPAAFRAYLAEPIRKHLKS
jgi:thiol-disulfide isomerase/thioredoxin